MFYQQLLLRGQQYLSPVTLNVEMLPDVDAEQRRDTGQTIMNSTDLELCYDFDGSFHQIVGIPFTGLNLPKYANIITAYIQFTTEGTGRINGTGTPTLTIYGEAADAPAAFATTTNNLSGRTWTTRSSTWVVNATDWTGSSIAGVNQRTSSLKTIIEELLQRPGYNIDSAMHFFIQGNNSDTASVWAENTGNGLRPVLHLQYSVPVGSVGNELIKNGVFADASNWTLRNGSTISGGVASVVSAGDLGSTIPNWSLEQTSIFTYGENVDYEVKFRARQTTGTGNLKIGVGYYGKWNNPVTTSWVSYTATFSVSTGAEAGHTSIVFAPLVSGDVIEIDDVSVKYKYK